MAMYEPPDDRPPLEDKMYKQERTDWDKANVTWAKDVLADDKALEAAVIANLSQQIHQTAVEKGWWDYPFPGKELEDAIGAVKFNKTQLEYHRQHCSMCPPNATDLCRDGEQIVLSLYNAEDQVTDLIKDHPPRTFGDCIALAHSELSEALEAFREDAGSPMLTNIQYTPSHPDKPEGVAVELADCIIRILDMAVAFKLPIAEAVLAKMDYNKTRPYRHGGKRL